MHLNVFYEKKLPAGVVDVFGDCHREFRAKKALLDNLESLQLLQTAQIHAFKRVLREKVARRRRGCFWGLPSRISRQKGSSRQLRVPSTTSKCPDPCI